MLSRKGAGAVVSMGLSLIGYNTLIFDCDGVILDSNKVKTSAFYHSTLSYGELAAQRMVDYHVKNGGISRYKKFSYFLERIAPKARQDGNNEINTLLHRYAKYVHKGLLTCDIAIGLDTLRKSMSDSRWLVVSGGDQNELNEVFKKRSIAEWFNGGIFGSPDSKDDILARELYLSNIEGPALFIGDSKYDYQAAKAANVDFIFLSEWSEVSDWKSWVESNNVTYDKSIISLINRSFVFR